MSASSCGHSDRLSSYPPPAKGLSYVGVGDLRRVVRRWRSWSRERRVFASLDDRDLHDLGLSRWDVEREIARPFWRD